MWTPGTLGTARSMTELKDAGCRVHLGAATLVENPHVQSSKQGSVEQSSKQRIALCTMNICCFHLQAADKGAS